MPDFWNQIFLSNPVKRYAFVAIAIVIGLLFKRMISKYIAGLLYRVVRKLGSGDEKESFIKLLISPLETFLIILIGLVAFEKLHYPELLDFDIYEINVKIILQALAKTALLISFTWLLLRVIDFIAMILEWRASKSNDMRDNQLIIFFRDFLKAVVSIIGLLMVLGIAFNFHISNALTGVGIATAAIALAAKESLENLIASFIIFFDKPFTVGDVLKVNNITGTVEKIGLRSTRIRTELKTYVTVPNKQMVDSIVDNQTLRTQRKAEIRLQVGLYTPVGLIEQFIEGIRKILIKDDIENPTVFLNDIGGAAFLVNVDFFTPPISIKAFNEIKQEVNVEILQLMEELKIELAAANTDVRLVQ